MRKYREGFSAALQVHRKLGFIKAEDVERLNLVLLDLTENNESGDSLRIKIKDDGDLVTDVEDLVKDFEDLEIGC